MCERGIGWSEMLRDLQVDDLALFVLHGGQEFLPVLQGKSSGSVGFLVQTVRGMEKMLPRTWDLG